MEKVDEVYGDANAYDFGARIYDPRIGRWLAVDKAFNEAPGWSPYRAFFNNPLYWVDLDGNIEWPLKGDKAVNKKDADNGGWGLKKTVIRTSTYLDTDRPKGATNPHIGIDYRASVGTSFYSLGDGKVTATGETSKGAKYITVEYSNGDQIRFLHIDKIADGLVVGSTVREGQPLGETGSTGTKQPHLHIDGVNKHGVQIDPEGTNYGKLTNETFFGKYEGDYTKVPKGIDYADIANKILTVMESNIKDRTNTSSEDFERQDQLADRFQQLKTVYKIVYEKSKEGK